MDEVSYLISDLLRAANDTGEPELGAGSDLLYRAIVRITELREEAGIPKIGTSSDAIIGLRDAAAEGSSRRDRSTALLEAADMLRTLRILVSSGVTVTIYETAT